MSGSQYRRGNAFKQIYLSDDFVIFEDSGGRIAFMNRAKTTFKKLNCVAVYLSDAIMFSKSGDHLQLGWDGTRAAILPPFTTAEWNGLSLTEGIIGFDETIDVIKTYRNSVKAQLPLVEEAEVVLNNLGAILPIDRLHDVLVTNTNPQTVTDMQTEYEGQIIRMRFGDGNTTLQDGTNIFLSAGGNVNFATNEMCVLISRGGNWYQIGGRI